MDLRQGGVGRVKIQGIVDLVQRVDFVPFLQLHQTTEGPSVLVVEAELDCPFQILIVLLFAADQQVAAG